MKFSINPITIYRNWRETKAEARQVKSPRKRKELEKQAGIHRRQFLILTIGGAVAGGGSLAYYLLTRKSETKRISSNQSQETELKTKVLKILKEVQTNNSMSPRYLAFIEIMTELIKAGEIHFGYSRKLKYSAAYRHPTDTVEINPDIFIHKKTYSNSILIHELFHAFQDYQIKSSPNSKIEAEAHLAQADFLYHQGQSLPETWLNIINHPEEGKYDIWFNVPPSIIRKNMEASFASKEYNRIIDLIAENYLWMYLFTKLYGSSFVKKYTVRIRRSGLSLHHIEKSRKKLLGKMYALPANQAIAVQKSGIGHVSSSVRNYLATSRVLVEILWDSGRKAEANSLLNKIFEEFKSVFYSSVDISKIDNLPSKRIKYDGLFFR